MTPLMDFHLGKKHALIGSVLLLVALSLVDATTSSQLNLAPLYLAPVLLATWYAGAAWGFGLSLAAVAIPASIGVWAGHHYSHAFYFYADLAGRTIAFLVFLWVVTIAARLRAAYDLERTQARTDFLTGIANRAAFFETLAKEVERHSRYQRPFSLISLDCDNFKTVNDQFGHAAGDTLLRTVARTLATGVRKTDLAARLGGDEFIVLVPETDTGHSAELVEHLKARLTEAMRANHWPVTFSIGVAVFNRTPEAGDKAVEFADSLMYRAKRAGKNQTVQELFNEATPFP